MSEIPIPSAEDEAQLVETRRRLHRRPELKYEEHETAAFVAERLEALGYEPDRGVGKTGVTALLEGASPGRTVLLRADMDALPIEELNDVPYRSETPGRMHACGHDCHMAIGLGAAAMLVRLPALPRGNVKLVFQPAEEGGNGARAMIEAGVLESPKVDAAFGLHVWNHLDTGQVAVVDGPFMGAIDRFRVRIQGRGGHGAMPELCRDPIVAAAHVVTALQTVTARTVDPLEGCVVTIGAVHGGDAFNVIPDEVALEGTARCFDDALWESLPGRIEMIAKKTAEALGCEAEFEIERITRATVNDPAMAEIVREVAYEVVGRENVVELRTLTSEDFGEFLRRVPGCFFFVGSRNEAKGAVHPHHSPRFDVDEDVLPIGLRMLLGVGLRYLDASS